MKTEETVSNQETPDDSQREAGLRELTCSVGDFVTAKLRYGKRGEPRQGWIKSWNPFLIVGQTGKIYECKGEPVKVTNPPECPQCQGRGDMFWGSLYHTVKVPCPICQANDETLKWNEDRF